VRHPLVSLCQTRHPPLHLLEYVEQCLRKAESSLQPEVMNRLRDKLSNPAQFWAALAELEWISLLADEASIVVEPYYPQQGPDLAIELGRKIEVEISSLAVQVPDRVKDFFSKQLQERLSGLLSGYLCVSLSEGLMKNCVFDLVREIKRSIPKNIPDNEEVSLYFYGDGRSYFFKGTQFPDDVYINPDKFPSYVRSENPVITVRFLPVSSIDRCVVCVGDSYSVGEEKIKSLCKKILGKRRQFRSEPAIVILDVSLASPIVEEIEINQAIHGTVAHVFRVDRRSRRIVDERWVRRSNGAFQKTKGLSAVIVSRRIKTNGSMILDAYMEVNPRARTQLTDGEIQFFRSLGVKIGGVD